MVRPSCVPVTSGREAEQSHPIGMTIRQSGEELTESCQVQTWATKLISEQRRQ